MAFHLSLAVYVCVCRYEEALVLYDGIMEEHPTCSAVWKRKISVLRAQNNVQDAVAELNKMLHV